MGACDRKIFYSHGSWGCLALILNVPYSDLMFFRCWCLRSHPFYIKYKNKLLVINDGTPSQFPPLPGVGQGGYKYIQLDLKKYKNYVVYPILATKSKKLKTI